MSFMEKGCAVGFMADCTSVTEGNTSYSTSIRSTAMPAMWGLMAATPAMGWPLYSALSRANTLSLAWRIPWSGSSMEEIGRSLTVTTALTPGVGLGLAGVNRLDAGVGMGAAEHLSVQQSTHLEVSAILGSAGDLVGSVMTDGPGPNYVVIRVGQHNIRHSQPPRTGTCMSAG